MRKICSNRLSNMKRYITVCVLMLASLGLASLKTSEALAGREASDGAPRITPAELRSLVKKNQAVIVDVRSPETYKAGHIKGAISIPYAEIGNRSNELPRDKLIATYCS